MRVLTEVPTFIVAGHETTSTATSWCLYALCKRPELQNKLREELLTVPTDTPTMEELNALPFLDLIVRETLRLYAPVTITSRVAVHDDVLPLSEPITDKSGNVLHEIPIRKNQRIVIPILALQTSKQIWGEDAFEFKWVFLPSFDLPTYSRRHSLGLNGGSTRLRLSLQFPGCGAIC